MSERLTYLILLIKNIKRNTKQKNRKSTGHEVYSQSLIIEQSFIIPVRSRKMKWNIHDEPASTIRSWGPNTLYIITVIIIITYCIILCTMGFTSTHSTRRPAQWPLGWRSMHEDVERIRKIAAKQNKYYKRTHSAKNPRWSPFHSFVRILKSNHD